MHSAGETRPVFIVSTGRCGSTMLSNMVRMHPRLLSVSEFFSALAAGALRQRTMDGERAFRLLNTPRPAARALLGGGLRIPEFLYPFGPGARYSPEEVPPIMCTALPHLSDDPEALWDELASALRSRGRHRLTSHYRFVFEWLAHRFGKSVWLERSGGSLLLVPSLARHFPDARFVHIFRDGRDAAISMHGHHAFRAMALAALATRRLGLDPFRPPNWPGTSWWVPAVARLQFRLFSVERYLQTEIELPVFGWLWSNMIERGIAYLNGLSPERVLSLRVEAMLASPKEEIGRFIDFVGAEYGDAEWMEQASALPHPLPPRWTRLPPEEHARLAGACAPGQRILGYESGRLLDAGRSTGNDAP